MSLDDGVDPEAELPSPDETRFLTEEEVAAAAAAPAPKAATAGLVEPLDPKPELLLGVIISFRKSALVNRDEPGSGPWSGFDDGIAKSWSPPVIFNNRMQWRSCCHSSPQIFTELWVLSGKVCPKYK